MKDQILVGNYDFRGACQSLLIMGFGLLGLSMYLLKSFSFSIEFVALGWVFIAMFLGFLLRCVRRKLFFGKGMSFHQSLSFEVVTQAKQALNPLLPDRAFESEFTERETGLESSEVNKWIKVRVVSSYAIMLLALVWLSHLYGLRYHVYVLFGLAAVVIISVMIRNKTMSGATINTIASGVVLWGVEGFFLSKGLLLVGMSVADAWAVYLLFTVLVEMTPIPFGIGVAELPLIFFGNGAALSLIICFHLLRLCPIVFLGSVYLPRYKFSVSDFFNSSLIAILGSSHNEGDDSQQECREKENSVDLSIVIPAYNEEKRLPGFLSDVIEYIEKIGINAEILIVDDGSKDATAQVVDDMAKRNSKVKLIKQIPNQGKGAAVRRGVLESEGKFIIYADADGATPISELDKFIPLMMESASIVIGSRKAGSDEVDRARKGIRALMGIFFYKIVNFFAVPGIQDTQCGFKMFRRDIARKIFSRAMEKGWAFDVELLYIAQLLGCSIHEVPVNWHEVEGSKVNPLKDSLKMLVAIFRIRSAHGGFLNNA